MITRLFNRLCLYLGLFTVMGIIGLAASVGLLATSSDDATAEFRLPTRNDGLLREDFESFFQPTISKRLASGMYGFVRSTSPLEPPPYLDHFHEGIDIKPLTRDWLGRPRDPVLSAAPGEVVYVNPVAGLSNYGKYIMVRHRYGAFDLYTTYAHLSETKVATGTQVQAGDPLGVLGYTGVGITKDRAHLHFEIGFLVNRHYESWLETHPKNPPETNRHGLYNGRNFLGVDPVPILLATAKGQPLDIHAIFAREEPCFRVRVKAGLDYFDWQKRFPFQTQGALNDPLPLSWEITFNRIGHPLKFSRSEEPTEEPVVVWFDWKRSAQDSYTRGLVNRVGQTARLTKEGREWISLLCYIPEGSR